MTQENKPKQLSLFPLEDLVATEVVDNMPVEDKIYGAERLLTQRPKDNDSMSAMYIGFVRKIYDQHGDEGFTYFVQKYREAGGEAHNFNFNGKSYRAFKYALANIYVRYGKL